MTGPLPSMEFFSLLKDAIDKGDKEVICPFCGCHHPFEYESIEGWLDELLEIVFSSSSSSSSSCTDCSTIYRTISRSQNPNGGENDDKEGL